jgi:hypothetical protein
MIPWTKIEIFKMKQVSWAYISHFESLVISKKALGHCKNVIEQYKWYKSFLGHYGHYTQPLD